MGELTLGIVLEPDTHSLAHCMLLRAYLIYSFLLLNDLFQFHLCFLLDAPQHISVNGFVRPWGVFGGVPASQRPSRFRSFPSPLALRFAIPLTPFAATHDIAEGER